MLLANGGTVVQFVGDAVMVLFNAPARQPDHALRAARAALGMQAAIEAVAEREPDWPRFRIGINTGPALIGNIGSDEFRNFTAIGDTVNLAARLEQEVAEAGQVVLGDSTQAAIKHLAIARPSTPSRSRASATPSPAGSSRAQGRPHHLDRPLRPRTLPRPRTPPLDLDERSCFYCPHEQGNGDQAGRARRGGPVASRVGLSGLTMGRWPPRPSSPRAACSPTSSPRSRSSSSCSTTPGPASSTW